MPSSFQNLRMHDGSRHFADLPELCDWAVLRDHAALLPGAEAVEFLTDHVTSMWLTFTYRGHRFSVNNQFGAYWLFVKDPDCADEVLTEVVENVRQAGNGLY